MMAEAHIIEAEAARLTPSALLRWHVLLITVLVYTLNIADRYVVSTVLEPIKVDLRLSNLGLSLVTAWPLAVLPRDPRFPAVLADRPYIRRNIIAISMIA